MLTTLRDAARDHLAALGDPADPAAAEQRSRGHRGVMSMVKAAVVVGVADAAPTPERVAAASGWLAELEALQAPTGLFNSGDNLASPPDSAFTLTDVGLVLALLRDHAWPGDLTDRLEGVLRRALPAVVAGGVHTPNHRWEISGALAQAGALLDDAAATGRALEWLTEGIDVDDDGIYSERSPIYASHVSNPSLLILSEALNRPDLLTTVHTNLHSQLDLTSPDGSVETICSRRQDQTGEPFPLGPFLSQFARFAASCPRCRQATARAGAAARVDPVDALVHAMLDDDVRDGFAAAGPPAGPATSPSTSPSTGPSTEPTVTSPEAGERFFGSLHLLRRWQGRDWTTVYAGSDVPAAGRVASGLACNPTFLRLGRGDVGVESVRLSRDFFGLGPVRPTTMERDGDRITLREEVSAGYYQPLPAQLRRPGGDYALEFEGRFAASMAFRERAVDLLHLRTTIDVDLFDDGVTLTIETDGPVAAHVLELALPAGGELTGAVELGAGRFHLRSGEATFTRGADTLVIGPVADPGTESTGVSAAAYHPGEAYTFLGGTDAVGGMRLYVTWTSPGTTALTIRRAT